MPVAAARLADVGARDPQPPVLGGGVEHALEQLAVAGLQLAALPQREPRLTDPGRKRVADRLQIAQAERPRLARHRADCSIELQAREGLRDERAQLGLEAADLAPQLRPGKALVASDAKRAASLE